MRRASLISIVPVVFLVSLLPALVLLVASYFQTISRTQNWLNGEVQQSVRRTDRLLTTAENLLNRIAVDTRGKSSPEALNLIRRTVYNDPHFREVGIINEQGFLVLTSLGAVNPPLPVPKAERANPEIKSLQVLGLIRTAVMREKSLILSLPTQGKGEVNLLVDPVVLSYFLGTAELGTNGYIAAFTPDGQLVAGVGVLPHRIDSKILSAKPQGLSSLDSSKIQVRQSTRDGKLTLVGEVPVSWVLRYWWRDLIFGAPLALVCSGVLTSLFMRFARRTYGIEQEIQLGLKNYEFEVYYQPIIDLQTERCVGSEALIRWRHPELGLVLPEVFIPIAEKTGMIRSLSQWVIQRAIQDQITLLQSADFYTSINLSPSLLTSKDFLEDVVRTLKANALPSTRILFEITENRLLDTIHLANLSRYRDLGLRLALDDFGTGYANFDYLDRFEFDFLKIDRYFVQRIRSDEVRNPVVDTLIELSQSLGFEIVAEGVETKAQRHYLHRFGVQYAQGWLFARAMPLEEFKQFLANRAED